MRDLDDEARFVADFDDLPLELFFELLLDLDFDELDFFDDDFFFLVVWVVLAFFLVESAAAVSKVKAAAVRMSKSNVMVCLKARINFISK